MYRIYTIFHKYIIDDIYDNLQLDNFTFIKCNSKFPLNIDNPKYTILKESDIGEFYNPKLQTEETPYHASSVLYTIYKNGTYLKYPFIGFIEYDMDITSDVINTLEYLLSEHKRIIVPFSHRWTIHDLHKQKNILAASHNAIEQIIEDYNIFHNTSFKVMDLMKFKICTQQSFLCDRNTFEQLMKFISHVIETGKAERKGSKPRPSTLMERYIGITLLLDSIVDNIEVVPLSCTHLSCKEWNYDQSKIQFSI